MNTINTLHLRTLLEQNNIEQPKAKYSNNVLLAMLQDMNATQEFVVEPSRGNFPINRGSLCEEIIKVALGGNATKSSKRVSDLTAENALMRATMREYGLDPSLKYEIKFATSFAPASNNKPKTKFTILVVEQGIYLVENAKHQKRFDRNAWFGFPRLDKLSKRLGLWVLIYSKVVDK